MSLLEEKVDSAVASHEAAEVDQEYSEAGSSIPGRALRRGASEHSSISERRDGRK